MTIGLIVGAITDAAVGGTIGVMEGGQAKTAYELVTSPRKIVDRCRKNRGYKILSDLGKGARGVVQSAHNKKPPDICPGGFFVLGSPAWPVGQVGGLPDLRPSSTSGIRPDVGCAPAR